MWGWGELGLELGLGEVQVGIRVGGSRVTFGVQMEIRVGKSWTGV